jgi:hypothetical protein
MVQTKFEGQDMGGAQFINVNLHKATFEDVNMAGTVIHNANLTNVVIYDANITGMTIFGIRIDELIEAELDRRDPVRVHLRIKDIYNPDDVLQVMSELYKIRAAFMQSLRSLSSEMLNNHPGPDRWSALEHVRHLVFAEDLYLNRWILRNDKPWVKLGFLPPFLFDNPTYADVGTEPTQDLESVLAAWEELNTGMRTWVNIAKVEDLQIDTSKIAFGQRTVGDVMQTLAGHELTHIRMAERAIADSGGTT